MSTPLEFFAIANANLLVRLQQMELQMGQLNMSNQFLQSQLAASAAPPKVAEAAAAPKVVEAAAAPKVVEAAAAPEEAEAAAAPEVAEAAQMAGGGAAAAAGGGGGSSASVCSSKQSKTFNQAFLTWCYWAGKCKGKDTWCKKAHDEELKEWANTPMKNRCTHGDWQNPDCIKWCPNMSCPDVHHPSTDRTPIRCPFQKEGQTCWSTSCTRNLHEGAEGYKEARTLKQFQAHKAKVSKP